MINHAVILNLSRRVSSAQKASILNAIQAMRESVPNIVHMEYGFNIGLSGEEDASFSILAKFESREDYVSYANHPAHLQFIEHHLKPIVSADGRRAIQYEVYDI